MKIRVRCPAKINTFLAVGPKDQRGYHPLRTRFQAIAIFDELVVEAAAEDSFEYAWPNFPKDNTVTRALNLLRDVVGIPPLKITLSKGIPAEAGLGGGSSDAAGLLHAIGHFLEECIPDEIKKQVAIGVGADVPFFLMGGHAQAQGYGQELVALPDRPVQYLVVVRPDAGVSTAAAYQSLDLKPYPWRDFPDSADELYNDFERVMPCGCDDRMDRLLVAGADKVLLCGSGSAFFGIFSSANGAQIATTRLASEFGFPVYESGAFMPRNGPGIWATRTLSRKESVVLDSPP